MPSAGCQVLNGGWRISSLGSGTRRRLTFAPLPSVQDRSGNYTNPVLSSGMCMGAVTSRLNRGIYHRDRGDVVICRGGVRRDDGPVGSWALGCSNMHYDNHDCSTGGCGSPAGIRHRIDVAQGHAGQSALVFNRVVSACRRRSRRRYERDKTTSRSGPETLAG